MGIRHRDLDDREAKALGLLAPGVEVARVIVGEDDDLVVGRKR